MSAVSSVDMQVLSSRRFVFYDWLLSPFERLVVRPWRRRVLSRATGPHLLDAGFGCGRNTPYYLAGIKVTGISDNAASLKRSESRHSRNPISRYTMPITELRFQAQRFDQAVAAFALSKLANPQVGLAELHRVVKGRGKVYLLDYSRPRQPALALLLDLARPLLRFLGRYIPRDLATDIRASGFKVLNEQHYVGGLVRCYECQAL